MKIINIINNNGDKRIKSHKKMVQETGIQINMMKWNSITSAIQKNGNLN